ncbi:MAG: alpha-L-fucosidase [Marinifilum sp.]|jgi:alpha-L-fucosidase|nr:alpha-L-fucosidase [Marinifilum sp.]
MNTTGLILFLSLLITLLTGVQEKKDYLEESETEYEERMQWFIDAKYGMFIHFGLYSQLGGVWKNDTIDGYAEWIQARADIVAQEYTMLTHTFNPKDFDANKIVSLAKKAGMKYIIITTKHHEGFCLWDSKYTNFDVANTPFKRDILAELSKACRANGIRFGTYYSIIDWHHESQQRNATGENWWTRWGHVQMKVGQKSQYIKYMKHQIKELVENYDTDILWFDGDWVDWWSNDTGVDLYNYIRGLKPNIIINNRVAKRHLFKKDFGTPEQEHLKEKVDYEWEACYTLNKSWGFKLNDHKWKSPETVYNKMKEINSNGGNLLLNIGPDGNGNVPSKSVEILIEVGNMLNK